MPQGRAAMIDTKAEQRFDRFQVWAVIAFTLLYLIIGLNASFSGGNWEFVFYIGVVLGLGFLILAIRRRAGFTPGLLWALEHLGIVARYWRLGPGPLRLADRGSQARVL